MTPENETKPKTNTNAQAVGVQRFVRFDSCDAVVKQYPEDCYECIDEELCPNCGCDMSDVFYLFSYYRCDNCADLESY